MAEVKAISASEYKSKAPIMSKNVSTNIYNIFLVNSTGTNLFSDSENATLLSGMINAVELLTKNSNNNSGLREVVCKDGKILKLFDMDDNLSLVINYDRDVTRYSEVEELMTDLTDKARHLINEKYTDAIKKFNSNFNTCTLSGMREDITSLFSKYTNKMASNMFNQVNTYVDLLFKHPEANNVYPLISEIRALEPLMKTPRDAKPLLDSALKLESFAVKANENQILIKIECSYLKQILGSYVNYKK
jgi:hypothetical protein